MPLTPQEFLNRTKAKRDLNTETYRLKQELKKRCVWRSEIDETYCVTCGLRYPADEETEMKEACKNGKANLKKYLNNLTSNS